MRICMYVGMTTLCQWKVCKIGKWRNSKANVTHKSPNFRTVCCSCLHIYHTKAETPKQANELPCCRAVELLSCFADALTFNTAKVLQQNFLNICTFHPFFWKFAFAFAFSFLFDLQQFLHYFRSTVTRKCKEEEEEEEELGKCISLMWKLYNWQWLFITTPETQSPRATLCWENTRV